MLYCKWCEVSLSLFESLLLNRMMHLRKSRRKNADEYCCLSCLASGRQLDPLDDLGGPCHCSSDVRHVRFRKFSVYSLKSRGKVKASFLFLRGW